MILCIQHHHYYRSCRHLLFIDCLFQCRCMVFLWSHIAWHIVSVLWLFCIYLNIYSYVKAVLSEGTEASAPLVGATDVFSRRGKMSKH